MRAGWLAVASPSGVCTSRSPPPAVLRAASSAAASWPLRIGDLRRRPQLQRAPELRLGGQRIAHAGGDAPAQQVGLGEQLAPVVGLAQQPIEDARRVSGAARA